VVKLGEPADIAWTLKHLLVHPLNIPHWDERGMRVGVDGGDRELDHLDLERGSLCMDPPGVSGLSSSAAKEASFEPACL
jgi:hypothetical protein